MLYICTQELTTKINIMKIYTGIQKSGMKLQLSCKAESLELAKKYFSEKSSIECDVTEDTIQDKWTSSNGYEGHFVKI